MYDCIHALLMRNLIRNNANTEIIVFYVFTILRLTWTFHKTAQIILSSTYNETTYFLEFNTTFEFSLNYSAICAKCNGLHLKKHIIAVYYLSKHRQMAEHT